MKTFERSKLSWSIQRTLSLTLAKTAGFGCGEEALLDAEKLLFGGWFRESEEKEGPRVSGGKLGRTQLSPKLRDLLVSSHLRAQGQPPVMVVWGTQCQSSLSTQSSCILVKLWGPGNYKVVPLCN